MNKLLLTVLTVVGMCAAGYGAYKTYDSYNVTENSMLIENVEALSDDGEDFSKKKKKEGTIFDDVYCQLIITTSTSETTTTTGSSFSGNTNASINFSDVINAGIDLVKGAITDIGKKMGFECNTNTNLNAQQSSSSTTKEKSKTVPVDGHKGVCCKSSEAVKPCGYSGCSIGHETECVPEGKDIDFHS